MLLNRGTGKGLWDNALWEKVLGTGAPREQEAQQNPAVPAQWVPQQAVSSAPAAEAQTQAQDQFYGTNYLNQLRRAGPQSSWLQYRY